MEETPNSILLNGSSPTAWIAQAVGGGDALRPRPLPCQAGLSSTELWSENGHLGGRLFLKALPHCHGDMAGPNDTQT